VERLDNAFFQVANILKAADTRHDPSDPVLVEHIGARAGYLIGVQVGLRRRGVQ
jgi:hypothetical protein